MPEQLEKLFQKFSNLTIFELNLFKLKMRGTGQ